MKMRIAWVLTLVMLATACTTNPYTGEQQASKTATGAAVGATVGAAVGALTGDGGDDRRKRALIGAGIGALAGGSVGAYMDVQETKLRQQLAGTGVSVTRMGNDIVLNMPGNITFDVNRSDVKAGFYPVLNSVALVLKEYKKTLIDVNGHTDSTGSVDYNMDLSVQRAQSVAAYLESQGVLPARIYTQGFGPHYPIADNSGEGGRALNRRVELVLKPLT